MGRDKSRPYGDGCMKFDPDKNHRRSTPTVGAQFIAPHPIAPHPMIVAHPNIPYSDTTAPCTIRGAIRGAINRAPTGMDA